MYDISAIDCPVSVVLKSKWKLSMAADLEM